MIFLYRYFGQFRVFGEQSLLDAPFGDMSFKDCTVKLYIQDTGDNTLEGIPANELLAWWLEKSIDYHKFVLSQASIRDFILQYSMPNQVVTNILNSYADNTTVLDKLRRSKDELAMRIVKTYNKRLMPLEDLSDREIFDCGYIDMDWADFEGICLSQSLKPARLRARDLYMRDFNLGGRAYFVGDSKVAKLLGVGTTMSGIGVLNGIAMKQFTRQVRNIKYIVNCYGEKIVFWQHDIRNMKDSIICDAGMEEYRKYIAKLRLGGIL